MTRTHRLLLSSLSTLFLGLALGGCATAGTSGKASPPNDGSDAAQLKSSEEPSEPPISNHALSGGEFSQPPADDVSAALQPRPAVSPSRPSTPTESHEAASAPAQPASGRASAPGHARSSASDKGADYGTRDEARPAPLRKSVERPGLATLWGETRESRVTTTSFTRGSSHPWFLYRIQYDDEAGIRARTGLDPFSFGSNRFDSQQGLITVELVDGSGNPLAGYMHGSRSFVIGHHGDRYGIRITNHSSERFEIVATVDGLDVLDGRPGSYAKRGYLVDADSSLEIEGFRRSTTDVATFRFGSVKDSYAARTSGDRNVGVIGVAVFREYQRVSPDRLEENRRRDAADPFPRYAAPPPPTLPIIRNW